MSRVGIEPTMFTNEGTGLQPAAAQPTATSDPQTTFLDVV